ncbi:MAG: rRNA maturation RNase YbeY [Gammaproteobacteria bacterium]|nr:rRNA maturation RNase YbeY [Gammaproteobacteria bacterium]
MPTKNTKYQVTKKNHNIVTNRIEVQFATATTNIPDKKKITSWARKALPDNNKNVELTIRVVDEEEIQKLNQRWRGMDKGTNVLSFPAGENIVAPGLLGDIAICAPIIEKEALEQNKSQDAHWAHMVIHGVLHLLGYDHIEDDDAEIMESHEINILNTLNFSNPYE